MEKNSLGKRDPRKRKEIFSPRRGIVVFSNAFEPVASVRFIYTGADLLLGPSSNLHKKVSVFHGVVVPTGIQPKNYASRWPLSGTNYPGKTSRNRRIYHLRIHPCTSNLLFPSRIFASRFDRCPIVLDSDSSIFLRVFSFCIRACHVILSFDLCSIFLFFFSLRKDKSPG